MRLAVSQAIVMASAATSASAAATATSAASKIVAVVTGGNKGIGLECCRLLAFLPNVHCILTARDKGRGTKARDELIASGAKNVSFMQLDISDKDSVKAFTTALRKEHGKLDWLVNNAGIYTRNSWGHKEAKLTFAVNYYGTMAVTDTLLDLVKKSDNGRIVNERGHLRVVKDKAKRAAITAVDATRESLNSMAEEFIASIGDGTYAAKGFPRSMYDMSKVLENAYTKVVARECKDNANMEVNAVCPGWCCTDMSAHRGPRTPAKGAETPVWLCTRPKAKDGVPVTGLFYSDKRPIKF